MNGQRWRCVLIQYTAELARRKPLSHLITEHVRYAEVCDRSLNLRIDGSYGQARLYDGDLGFWAEPPIRPRPDIVTNNGVMVRKLPGRCGSTMFRTIAGACHRGFDSPYRPQPSAGYCRAVRRHVQQHQFPLQ